MRNIAPALRTWLGAGEPVCLATVVGLAGSAPRSVGTAMAVSGSGRIAGSLSGGCVDSAVVDAARAVLVDGAPQLLSYGSSGDAPGVSLACGGSIDVLVRQITGDRAVEDVLDALGSQSPVVLATGVGGDGCGRALAVRPHGAVGSLGGEILDGAVVDDARRMLRAGTTLRRGYDDPRLGRASTTVFFESFERPPRMIVFGAVDFAAATARIGSFLGYRVTVCDARSAFATRDRFADVDEIVIAWPHRYLAQTPVDEHTVLCVLVHDPKFEVPLLEVALRTPAAFIGALGSRRTHEARVTALRRRGVAEDSLRRLRAPVGLDLGAQTPEETAVAIAAEIIAARSGGSARPLTELSGPIHAVRSAAHACG